MVSAETLLLTSPLTVLIQQANEISLKAQTEWTIRITDIPQIVENLDWIFHLSTTRIWQNSDSFLLLYFDYQWPWEWQASLAKTVEAYLLERDAGIIRYLCPAQPPSQEHYERIEQSDELLKACARSIIGQIFAKYPATIEKVDKVQQEVQNQLEIRSRIKESNASNQAVSWQSRRLSSTGQKILWRSSFSSPNADWRDLWSLLGCALRSIPDELVVMLAGFHEDAYSAFFDGLKYLHPIFPTRAKTLSTESSQVQPKFILIGDPLLEVFHSNPEFDQYARFSARLCEETEAQGK
jgi:hypothetical protein